MCRWLAYSGNPIPLETLLFLPKNNLIDQSLSSKSAETPTNGDGFGLGWYGRRQTPALYRSCRPAWSDSNLRDLAANIESSIILAHVRATSMTTVQETNCHPFRWRNWLFVHNGEIFGIERTRRDLLFEVAPEIFENILGSTDSELMFHLAITLGLDTDPPGALRRMAELVERVSRTHSVEEALWMTVAVTDGTTIHCVRYASDGEAPTLYHSRDVTDIRSMDLKMSGDFGDSARAIVSEPVGRCAQNWVEIPQNSLLSVCAGEFRIEPFMAAG